MVDGRTCVCIYSARLCRPRGRTPCDGCEAQQPGILFTVPSPTPGLLAQAVFGTHPERGRALAKNKWLSVAPGIHVPGLFTQLPASRKQQSPHPLPPP
ncbi:hypothetical protein XA68_15831 [Ophiocordyceps unilateralis]|uniref:Uncharacterized protein n=1 Tax=Ophiocordyceps unilateralis TaxID=268505 RepID=A0A2A9P7B3_OPHUN|nr:hypothetical protein XA68_15831 [Ophiocordyceps unilateralis]